MAVPMRGALGFLGAFSTARVSPFVHIAPWAAAVSIPIRLPSFLGDIWESVLRAVPKQKTSHRRKRQRFLAGKALKDVTALNKCPACGNVKKAHVLCPFCVKEIQDMWKSEGSSGTAEAKVKPEAEAKAEAKQGA